MSHFDYDIVKIFMTADDASKWNAKKPAIDALKASPMWDRSHTGTAESAAAASLLALRIFLLCGFNATYDMSCENTAPARAGNPN